jgi:hypothetical protein
VPLHEAALLVRPPALGHGGEMRLLKIPDHPRAIIYTLIVQALKSDPTLRRLIGPDAWRTYTDEPNNDTPPGEDTLPAIEVLPFGLAAGPESPIASFSPLGIQVNIATEGLDVRDLLNLWGAVEGALFKGDGSRVLGTAIRAAIAGSGAQYETMNLSSPAISPTQHGLHKQVMLAGGTLNVMMRVPK